MPPTDIEHAREHIEIAIERAREGIGERIDAIDSRIRSRLDFGKMVGDHAPEFLAIGFGVGFLIGFGVPKLLGRTIQFGVPLLLAIRTAKKRQAE
ncbi:MAG: hypothetical protein ACYC7A_06275 [Thermoanaerobaculia bacterium]